MRRGRRIEERPRTPLDLRWPDTAEYTELARTWSADAVERMLTAVWRGYDVFLEEVLAQIDITQADEELERAITQLLEPHISRQLSGDEPYYVQHGPYEYATRQPAPAQPPQYDLAFVLHQNPKVMWPLEAKLLRSDGTVAPPTYRIFITSFSLAATPLTPVVVQCSVTCYAALQQRSLITSRPLSLVGYSPIPLLAHGTIEFPIILEVLHRQILCPVCSNVTI